MNIHAVVVVCVLGQNPLDLSTCHAFLGKRKLLFTALAQSVNVLLSCLNERPMGCFLFLSLFFFMFLGENEVIWEDDIAVGAQHLSA